MSECKHRKLQTWHFEDDGQPAGMWSCVACGHKFVPMDLAQEKDAERYHKLRAMVRGERRAGSARPAAFAFPSAIELPPLADIMRGSVAQHLDSAIDALPAVGAA